MRIVVLVLVLLFVLHELSAAATMARMDYKEEKDKGKKVEAPSFEFFSQSGVEAFNNGSLQTSIQAVMLRIGEKRYSVPLFVFVTPSGPGFGAASSLLDPTGGVLNLSLRPNSKAWAPFRDSTRTRLKLVGQLTTKLVRAVDASGAGESTAIPLGYVDAGFSAQTGAWFVDDSQNIGTFWVEARLGGWTGPQADLQRAFGPELDKQTWGCAIDAGIDISERLNVHIGLYGLGSSGQGPLLDRPVVKYAFDYKPAK